MDKSPDAFRTISEVAEWLGVQAHVLRFWESKFTQVKPVKRAGGRRYYRPNDMLLLGGIKKLLHDDGLTVKGVQKILTSEGVEHVGSLSPELCEVTKDTVIQMVASPDTTPESAPNIVPFSSVQSDPAPAEKASSETSSETGAETPIEAVSDDTPVEPDTFPEVEAETKEAPVVPASLDAIEAEAESKQTPASSDPDPEMDQSSDQIIAPPPDAPVAFADTSPAKEKPILPSFLHRPAPETAPETPPETLAEPVAEALPEPDSAPDSEPPSAATPASAAPKSMVVDAPDPPNEDEIPCSQGPLGQLATLNTLSAAQIAEITPLADELKAWLSRSAGTAAR
ncbi:MAG: MerR family transcriptional regulator [Rhodobacteraceae bacterium]|nr:MerR family transcriptional regulator [Paracoccaceae bacterium]